jgi:hypothetical protein
MIEALTQISGSALSIVWPFYWPLLLAVTLRVALGVTVLWMVPIDGAIGHAVMFAVAVTLVGGLATVCAVMPGLAAFAATYLVAPDTPAESLAMALISAEGLRRIGVLVFVTTLILSVLSAGAGAILWFVFAQGIPHVSVVRWVLRNTAVWTLGFVGSLIVGLALAVTFPGLNADHVLGLGGFATGLGAANWVRDLAEGFEPPRATAEDSEQVDFPAGEGMRDRGEWYPTARPGL